MNAETPPAADLNPPGSVAQVGVLCLAFVVLADLLFYKQTLGWATGLYGLLLAGVVMARERYVPRGAPGVLIVLGTASLCLWCVEQPGAWTVGLGLLGLISVALVARQGWTGNALVWAGRWASFLLIGWCTLFWDALAAPSAQAGKASRATPVRRALANWLLPVLLTLAFLGLFSIANPVISKWVSDAWGGLGDFLDDLVSGGRILIWLLVAVWAWALLRHRSALADSLAGSLSAPQGAPAGLLSPGIVTRCLVLFNALFAVQTALDVTYLWGGRALPAGMTHTEYAHRGAYPLVATALLAALFVLAAFRAGSRSRQMRWPRCLVYAWLAQNVFLMVSAAWRLRLYVEAYSLTRLRLAAAVWMCLVACGLLWILARILTRRSNLWLINVNLVTALGVLYACSFGDWDAHIAAFNVRHCAEVRGVGPSLDVGYLEHLGPEALPALIEASRRIDDEATAQDVAEAVARLKDRLHHQLREWRGWTLRRRRLAAVADGAQPTYNRP